MAVLKDVLPLQSISKLDGRLVTITSVLGASANWIGLAFVTEELKRSEAGKRRAVRVVDIEMRDYISSEEYHSAGGVGDEGGGAVVVVSFMHDLEFWKDGLKRGGIDIYQQTLKGNFMFVDGLTALFIEGYDSATSQQSTDPLSTPMSPTGSVHNDRMSLSLGDFPTTLPARAYLDRRPQEKSKQGKNADIQLKVDLVLDSSVQSSNNVYRSLYDSISKAILKVTASSNSTSLPGSSFKTKQKPLLLIESPDLLVSTAEIPFQDVWNLILELRELSSATLLLLNADTPFITPSLELTREGSHPINTSYQTTRLETQLSGLLTTAIHNSYLTVSLRMLDTGVAKDVSGVMRITRGGDMIGEDDDGTWMEKEVLYHVGNSGVQIFERGEKR